MAERTITMRRGDRADVTVYVPEPERPVVVGMRPRGVPPEARVEPLPPPLVIDETVDAATNAFDLPGADGERALEYVQLILEGAPEPDEAGLDINRALIWEAVSREARMPSTGKVVSNNLPAQVDTNWANGSFTYILRHRNGLERDIALAPGVPAWIPPATIAERRASLALLRERAEPRERGRLDALEDDIRADELAHYGPVSTPVLGNEGSVAVNLPEGFVDLAGASYCNWESWSTNDPNYKLVEGESYYSPEVSGERLHVMRRGSTRVRVRLVPQLLRVSLQWVALYVIGFWGVVLPIPTTRVFSMRAPILPRVFYPRGAPSGFSVDAQMSAVIIRTQTFAEAYRSDEFLGLFYHLVGRIQGRFAVRLRQRDAKALCAVLEFDRGYGLPRKRVAVFRNEAVFREPDRLAVDGFYVPGSITPFIPELAPAPGFPTDIGSGI